MGETANKNVRDTVIAVNIDTIIPRPSVSAKPFTADEPSQNNTIAVMIDEMFEPRMDNHARENPRAIAS